MNTPTQQDWEERLKHISHIQDLSPEAYGRVKELIHQVIKEERQHIIAKAGQLRQWLNEDRITDPKRIVSTRQIIEWLELLDNPTTS